MQLTVIHVREDVWTWGHLDVDITADVIFLWAFPLQRGVGQTGSPVHHRTRFRPTLLILDVSYCGKKLPYRVFNDRHLLLKSMIYRHLQYCAINMLYVYYSIFYHAFYIYFIRIYGSELFVTWRCHSQSTSVATRQFLDLNLKPSKAKSASLTIKPI